MVARSVAKVIIISKGGVQYARNVQDVKIVPPPITPNTNDDGDYDELGTNEFPLEGAGLLAIPGRDSSVDKADKDSPDENSTESTNKRLRERRNISKPARYDNRYVYSLFF